MLERTYAHQKEITESAAFLPASLRLLAIIHPSTSACREEASPVNEGLVNEMNESALILSALENRLRVGLV